MFVFAYRLRKIKATEMQKWNFLKINEENVEFKQLPDCALVQK